MMERRRLVAIGLGVTMLVGCGDDEGSALSANAPDCATSPNPIVLELSNVIPSQGSSVPNADISHSFTIVDAPLQIDTLAFAFGSGHTAGDLVPPTIDFSIVPEGTNLRYQASGNSWSATGLAVVTVANRYETGDGSCYAFPDPLFEYGVTQP